MRTLLVSLLLFCFEAKVGWAAGCGPGLYGDGWGANQSAVYCGLTDRSLPLDSEASQSLAACKAYCVAAGPSKCAAVVWRFLGPGQYVCNACGPGYSIVHESNTGIWPIKCMCIT